MQTRKPRSIGALLGSTLGLTLFVSAGGCVTGGAAAVARTPQSAGEVRALVARSWAEHLAAAEAKDLDAVMAIYADDVVFVVLGDKGGEVRGAEALREVERLGLATRDVFDVAHSLRAFTLDGDLAHELGSIRGPVAEQGEQARDVVWHFMARWERGADGTWRITYIVGGYG